MGRELPNMGTKSQKLCEDQLGAARGARVPTSAEVNEDAAKVLAREEKERCGAVQGIPLYSVAVVKARATRDVRKLKRGDVKYTFHRIAVRWRDKRRPDDK